MLLECSPNFPSASYLDERTNVFSRHLFADVISVHNGNMKHALATEFDYTNLLAMLRYGIVNVHVVKLIHL